MSCSSCGCSISGDVRFCPHCGASQAPSGEERRVVTILFADIVGFTALAERLDPEEIKHVIDRAFERLARDINAFGGVVDKVLGDGIIALFGAPVAHEDDAERAVRAGLSMQQTLASLASLGSEMTPALEMRIGVNTGEVLVGPTTAGGDYTAMGDVMNLAHRLQELANPGDTLVGGDTRQATGEAISYRSVGTLPARGREQSIEAWVAIEPVRPPGSHRTRGEVFVGRGNELDLLAAQARLAVEGQRAQLSVIIGEAGIGKTRMVAEASTLMANQFNASVLEGRCLPYGEANVWWPVAELVRHHFDLSLDAPLARTRACLAEALGARLDPTTAGDVDRYTTALLHALGYDTPLRGGDRIRNRSEVMLAFTNVLAAELASRPVVLVVSDMHWAPTAVWKLMEHVLAELARNRLIVLMTARPTEEDNLPRGRYGSSVVQLGPLDNSASVELLNRLGLDLPEASEAELVDRSGGNPFFLEELAGLVAKEGAVEAGVDSEFDIAHVDTLPATLRGTISARLDALDIGERGLLEDASVLGRTGSIAGLTILARESRGVTEVTEHLADLVAQDLLELNGPRYRFRSNLVRDVAYGRLTKTVRAQRHYGIAHHMEEIQGRTIRNSVVVAIAEHYRAAAQLSTEVSDVPGVDRYEAVERALYWIEQAGERALDVGAPIQAARWYDFGVELADDDASLARYLFGRARSRTEIHDIHGARSDLERLEALPALDPVLAARAQLVRGDADRKAGYLDRAAGYLREAADRLAALGVADQQALALRLLGMTEMVRSDDETARKTLEASRAVAMESGERRAEAWALQSLAWHAFRLGHVLEASGLVTEAVDIFSELDDRGGLVWAQGVQAWVAFHSGDWEHARELVDAVLPETLRRGDPWAEGIMLNLDASLRLWSGQASPAAEAAHDAGAVAERVEHANLLVQARAIEGRALVSLGRIDEGTELLESAYSIADQADDRESRRLAVIANCASAARLGEPERAMRWAARYDGLGDEDAVGRSDLLVSLAAAMLQRGAVAEAMTQLVWIEGSAGHRGGRYAEAVEAIVAAAAGELGRSEELTALTLAGPATYLDRILALLARAAARRQDGDNEACGRALAEARAILEPTDDQPTRLLADLVAALCGQGSVVAAERRMRGGGLDPTGWLRAFTLAAHRPVG